MTNKEIEKQNELKLKKPLVYNKVIKYNDKVNRGESIAIVRLEYSGICPFNCTHCSARDMMAKKVDKFIAPNDVKNIYDQADKLGLAHATITGGNPDSFPDLEEVVKSIGPERFYIAIDSNGWNLDKEKVKKIKQWGVDKVQLSLDSIIKEEHDKFRNKKGSYDKAIKAIDYCLDNKLDLILQTVVTKDRLYSQEFNDYLNFAKSKDISVFATAAKPVGEFEGRYDLMLSIKDFDYLNSLSKDFTVFNHLTPSYGFNHGCVAVKKIITILKTFDVIPCQFVYCSIGNLLNESLETILDRGMKLKPFKTNMCPVAVDKKFVEKYLVNRMRGKEIPVCYKEVFREEDFE